MTTSITAKEHEKLIVPEYLKKSVMIGQVPVPMFRELNPRTHDLGQGAESMILALDTPVSRVLEPMEVLYATMTLEQLGFSPDATPSNEEVRDRVQSHGGKSCHELLALSVWSKPFGAARGRFLMYPVEAEDDSLVFEIQEDTGKRSLRGISVKKVHHWSAEVPVIFQL